MHPENDTSYNIVKRGDNTSEQVYHARQLFFQTKIDFSQCWIKPPRKYWSCDM